MPADYSKLRTPFYEIAIGDARGNAMQPLPPQIARLVEKVELMETLCCNSFHQITVTFNEGSREPYRVDEGQFAPDSAYPSSGEGLLSNQSGSLVDLRMSSGGLTSAISGVVATVTEAIADVTAAVEGVTSLFGKDNSPKEPKISIEKVPQPVDKDINFLLQQRNQIQITWGYKEDPITVRRVRGYIMIVSSEFPESGTPKTTVVAHSASAIADLMVTKKGKHFGVEVPVGISESGKPMFEVKDLSAKQLIEKLCLTNGLSCIVSNEFDTPEHEASKASFWLAGESLHQFFARMARRYGAVYQILTNPNTGKDTIVFISNDDWQSRPISSDPTWLAYKGNGSIIKSINIRADYGKGIGVFMNAVDEEGTNVTQETKTIKNPVFDGEANQDNSALGTNVPNIAQFADGISADGITANVSVSAESSPASMKGTAESEISKQGSNIVALDFTTIGHTRITPGNALFGGIGNRYTGYYNIQNVTHTLDSQGYNCKGYATSFKNAQGGINPAEPQPKAKPKQKKLNQFAPKVASVTDAMGQYEAAFIDNGQGNNLA